MKQSNKKKKNVLRGHLSGECFQELFILIDGCKTEAEMELMNSIT